MAQYSDPTRISVSSDSKLTPLSILVLVSGVVALVIAGYSFLAIRSTTSDTNGIQAKINTEESQLADLQTVAIDLASYSDLSKGLHTLFDGQNRWEDVLTSLQAKFYKRMKVTSLQVGSDKSVTITGTTPDYNQYAKVYSAFTSTEMQALIGNVQVVSVARDATVGGTGEVTFSFKGTLTDAALKPSAAPAAPSTPNTL